ncbi:MAG TPA: fibronectin type III domain-containing protein, partial [Saprospiraceae bacterium]|nr:fibronectin type III domain-containing protein [Saprospiraceae bacterium]
MKNLGTILIILCSLLPALSIVPGIPNFAGNPSYAKTKHTTTTTSATCSAPTQLSSTNISQNCASLSWAEVTGATDYSVQYKTTSASTWTPLTVTTNSLALSGLSAATGYNWQVKANCSGFSSLATFTTTAATSCSAPTLLSAINISSTGATLNWAAVTGATSYSIQYKTSSASIWNT